MLAAAQCIGIAAHLVGRLRNQLRNLLPPAVLVDGHKDEVGAGHVKRRSGLRVFSPHLDAHFHRSGEGAVDAGLEGEQIAEVHRLDEVDVVHGRGDDVGARVAIGGHGAGEIDKVHQAAAEQIAQSIGVVGQDNLGHLRLRAGYSAGNRIYFSGTHLLLAPFLCVLPHYRNRPLE